jgi:hypothetical protein
MTEVGKWRARAYWALTWIVLPLLNPIALAVISIGGDTQGYTWIAIAVGIVFVNLLLLWLAAAAIWKRDDGRRWRVATGLALAVALSFPYGFGELLLVLDISCPETGCLS